MVAGACSFWGGQYDRDMLAGCVMHMCVQVYMYVCLRVSVLVFPKAGAGCWVLPHFLLSPDRVSLSELPAAYFLCSPTTKSLGSACLPHP